MYSNIWKRDSRKGTQNMAVVLLLRYNVTPALLQALIADKNGTSELVGVKSIFGAQNHVEGEHRIAHVNRNQTLLLFVSYFSRILKRCPNNLGFRTAKNIPLHITEVSEAWDREFA